MPKTIASRINAAASAFRLAFETSLRKVRGGSDIERWGTQKALFEGWDQRTQLIAGLVAPGASVIEFGAGRMIMKKFLPETCAYTPSDLVDRGPGTVVCDLNAGALPDFTRHDVAVFSGVLEYVNDVPRLISHLSSRVGVIVTSYADTTLNKRNRRAQGWVNDFTSQDFLRIFEALGFRCDHKETWRSQVVYRFRKE